MYALAINGSPRKGGNTEHLLKTVLDELNSSDWETELVKIGGTAIRGCLACGKCFENKDNECIAKKDKLAWQGDQTQYCRLSKMIKP